MTDPCSRVADVSTFARPLPGRIVELPSGATLWHVGHAHRPFSAFDSRSDVESRFAPLRRDSAIVGTLYAAETKEAAVAETLWRSLPLSGADLPFERVANRPIGTVRTTRSLSLVELHDPGLRKLGLRPEQLTDTPALCYPRTRAFGQALLDDHPHLDGFVWMSSRFNRDRVYVLFDTDEPSLAVIDRTSFDAPSERDFLIHLCASAGITVTLPTPGM